MDKEKIEELLKRYVAPHKKQSRLVTNEDIKRVVDESIIMHDLCFILRGKCNGALAIAHQQIDDQNPLDFFVIRETGEIIINPKIVNHTRHTVDSEEGCLSFPDNDPIIVQRWNKIEVEYQTLGPVDGSQDEIKLVDMSSGFSGRMAKIYQHEIDHAQNIYIY